MKKIRYPRYAGTFYSASLEELNKQIESCFIHKFGPKKVPKKNEKYSKKVIGIVSPHAGYIYSGPVASHGYYRLSEEINPEVVIIFGPNHTGRGNPLAIMREGIWRTPLGDIEIDSEIAKQIINDSGLAYEDDFAHTLEHSIEVQLPFLQYIYGQSFKIVPICFQMQDLKTSHEIGAVVAGIIENNKAILIASTDLTHYEPHEIAKKKDRLIIESVLNLDENKLNEFVESHNITMCGSGPTIALIAASNELGAKHTELLSYRSSGEISGDFSAVVGYASILITK